SGDGICNYFKEGAEVEISSSDEGFRRSWYAGAVIRPPEDPNRASSKVLVEYKTLTESERKKTPLQEEVELVQLRPPPPVERGRSFKLNDEVDAYYNDGWWEGVITQVLAEDEFSVFFPGTREQISFKSSHLRLHREWVQGKWVCYKLAPSPSSSSKRKSRQGEHFCEGDQVEAHIEGDGFEGAWFAAKIVKKSSSSSKHNYLIEYADIREDDYSGFLRSEVDRKNIRPRPPYHVSVDSFQVGAAVEALYADGWWAGVIRRVFINGNYLVYFEGTGDEMRFNHSQLRIHQEWRQGKWH
ncbi:hypothetical protein M569_01661, partial [Genlisea aurea]